MERYMTLPNDDIKFICKDNKYRVERDRLPDHENLIECFLEHHQTNYHGFIEMDENAFGAVDCFIQYLKSGDYDTTAIGDHHICEGGVDMTVPVFEMAIYYDLTDLQNKAVKNFHRFLQRSGWDMEEIQPSIEFVCNYQDHADPDDLRPLRCALLDALLPKAKEFADHQTGWDERDKGKYFDFLQDLVWLLSRKADGEEVTGWSGEPEEETVGEKKCGKCLQRHS
ncbi:hypothetical protein PRZ48_004168 [Zasmidium cellare]|uniref:Uncharacterized protein n=1 Tax=Zasmidium cellare TaxID=395010 RepID=A0ABR0EYP9_ZASCE|nr:hypothetical protein PRZ48_004168 [Zasmidium cellare]